MKSLCEILWYIDGHHLTISDHGYQILACFEEFQGYNTPELVKHRKRSVINIPAAVIESLSTSTKLCLGYYKLIIFQEIHCSWEFMSQSCELLANTLHQYAHEIQD